MLWCHVVAKASLTGKNVNITNISMLHHMSVIYESQYVQVNYNMGIRYVVVPGRFTEILF